MSALFLSVILCSTNLEAQTLGQRNRAAKKLTQFQFTTAIDQYQKILEKHPDNYVAIRGMADSYRLLGDAENAEAWYAKAAYAPEAEGDSIVIFYYAQALRENAKYDLAKKEYQRYADKAPNDPRGALLAASMDKVDAIMADSMRWRVIKVDSINSEFYDFSPTYYGDSSLIFVSNRDKSKKEDVWSGGESFLNLMQCDVEDSSITNIEDLPGDINGKFHEGPAAISPDGKTIYFTRNFYLKRKKKSDQDIMTLNIFSATKDDDGNWGNLENLSFNSADYSCGHPTLTADGKTMYFSSNMPGSLGGFDLWKTEMSDSGTWSEPVNLGDGVNSLGDEFFPYIYSDGTLYFSSNSYEGLGGLDIYSATQTNGTWGNVTNMSYPLNTNKDDFGIIFNKDKKKGYFSSARPGGQGDDDIYAFVERELRLVGTTYEVAVNDDTLEEERVGTLAGVMVYLYNETDGTVDSTLSNADGKFEFPLERDKNYRLVGNKRLYFLKSEKTLSTVGKEGGTMTAELELYKIQGTIRLVNIYYDFDKYNIRPDAAKELDRVYGYLIEYPDLVIELRSHTDCRATKAYNEKLSQNRAQSAMTYLLNKGKDNGVDLSKQLSGAKGYGETMPIYPGLCATELGVRDELLSQDEIDKHQMNRRTEFVVIQQPSEIKVEGSTDGTTEGDGSGDGN